MPSFEHNIRFGLDQFISIEITYDRRLQDRRVRYECLVTRHQLARAAWLYLSYPVTDENVQDLSAANAVEDLYVEGFLEATKDIGRQGFTGETQIRTEEKSKRFPVSDKASIPA